LGSNALTTENSMIENNNKPIPVKMVNVWLFNFNFISMHIIDITHFVNTNNACGAST
jgi:hypothetical protein